MTAVDVDALDKLREAATAGPWVVDEEWIWGDVSAWGACGELVTKAEDLEDADAALIVATVNALPDLIAAVRERDALRAGAADLARKWLREGTAPTQAIELRWLLGAVAGGQQ